MGVKDMRSINLDIKFSRLFIIATISIFVQVSAESYFTNLTRTAYIKGVEKLQYKANLYGVKVDVRKTYDQFFNYIGSNKCLHKLKKGGWPIAYGIREMQSKYYTTTKNSQGDDFQNKGTVYKTKVKVIRTGNSYRYITIFTVGEFIKFIKDDYVDCYKKAFSLCPNLLSDIIENKRNLYLFPNYNSQKCNKPVPLCPTPYDFMLATGLITGREFWMPDLKYIVECFTINQLYVTCGLDEKYRSLQRQLEIKMKTGDMMKIWNVIKMETQESILIQLALTLYELWASGGPLFNYNLESMEYHARIIKEATFNLSKMEFGIATKKNTEKRINLNNEIKRLTAENQKAHEENANFKIEIERLNAENEKLRTHSKQPME